MPELTPPKNSPHPLRTDLWLGIKLLLASTALAVAIKAIGPRLGLPATPAVVMVLVLFPSLGMGLIFLARLRLKK
jgi:hypothetical protein